MFSPTALADVYMLTGVLTCSGEKKHHRLFFFSAHVSHISFHPPSSGGTCNLPTIPSASDFNTVLSSDQNTLDGTHSQHSQHSTSQDDMADIEEGNQCPAAVQLADAQVCEGCVIFIIC